MRLAMSHGELWVAVAVVAVAVVAVVVVAVLGRADRTPRHNNSRRQLSGSDTSDFQADSASCPKLDHGSDQTESRTDG